MVGIFSRFSSAGAHRRAKSAVVVETLAPNMNSGESGSEAAPADSPHGIEVGVEFKPVEHPVEPVNLDQPVKCPLPEPSILHDGRIWKERISTAGARAMTDLPVVKEGSQLESDSSGARSRSSVQKRAILPSNELQLVLLPGILPPAVGCALPVYPVLCQMPRDEYKYSNIKSESGTTTDFYVKCFYR